MADHPDIEHLSVEGVHILNDDSYRDYRRSSHVVLNCEKCGKKKGENGIDLKRCAGCFKVAFCSKECQAAFWPNHKRDCNTMKEGRFIRELVQSFYSSPLLLRLLRIALILRLGLQAFADTQKSVPCVVVHLHIVPISKDDKEALIHKRIDVKGKEKIPGYLEVGINSEPLDYIPIAKTRADETRYGLTYALYKQARKHADEQGREKNPIVLVSFGHSGSSMLFAIEITPDAFKVARGDYSSLPEILAQLIPHITQGLPLDVKSCLAFANTYIQLDIHNELQLRRDMTQADKVFARDMGRHQVFGEDPTLQGSYVKSA